MKTESRARLATGIIDKLRGKGVPPASTPATPGPTDEELLAEMERRKKAKEEGAGEEVEAGSLYRSSSPFGY